MGKRERDELAAAEPNGAAHPEEMRAVVKLRIGESIRFTATARATPAGIIAAALVTAAVTVPLIWIGRRRWR